MERLGCCIGSDKSTQSLSKLRRYQVGMFRVKIQPVLEPSQRELVACG